MSLVEERLPDLGEEVVRAQPQPEQRQAQHLALRGRQPATAELAPDVDLAE